MNNWKQICAREVARLESVRDLYKHARELASHGTAKQWIKNSDIANLESAKTQVDQKLARLRNGEFHVAVVGTEKAGKSTFINAWLGRDLLPNKSGRCTFTTTKLHSVLEESEQRLVVRPKTQQEFSDYCKILEQEAGGTGKEAELAREDLDVINKNKRQMLELVSEGEKKLPFIDLEQIVDDLERYAADARYAHAIKQVDLFTSSLANMDGVLFYDVPGLNSGLSKHEEETREMLGDSDAVIIVKSVERPDLDGPEKQILRFAEADTSIDIKDKVFLFGSKIDKESTREGLEKNISELIDNCKSFGIDTNKVFFGSAPASLRFSDQLKDTKYISSKEDLRRHLRELLNLPDDTEETILAYASVKQLRDRLDNYLENEREDILKSSVDTLIKDMEQSALAIYNSVKPHVPENSDDMKKQHEDEVMIEYGQWYNKFWENIKSEMDNDHAEGRVKDCVNKMESSYRGNVAVKLENIPHFQQEEQNKFFSSEKSKRGTDDYESMNADLRVEINKEVMDVMQELSAGLSWDLFSQLSSYLDELSAKFNNSINVREQLYKEINVTSAEDYKRQLESALSALFLRLVRPLARSLMKHRRGLPARREEVRQFGDIFRSLSMLYPDEKDDKYADLARYLAYGSGVRQHMEAAPVNAAKDLAKKGTGKLAEKVLKRAVGATGGAVMGGPVGAVAGTIIGDTVIDKVSDALKASGEAAVYYTSRDDIIRELDEDREALKIYLEDAVFRCSGIEDYAYQELLRLQEKFVVACEEAFRQLAGARFRYKDPAFMKLVPPHLQNTECDTQVADRLKELSVALQQRNSIL